MTLEKGFLVIAQGKDRYIQMARNIVQSIRLTNPGVPIALVTDSKDKEVTSLYDHVIPVNEKLGVGFIQKICMYDYSPFQKTLFIDVDCLVIRNLDFMWKLFDGDSVNVLGKTVTEGRIFDAEMSDLKAKLNIQFMPSFNGGVYYFEKSEKARQIFAKALNIFQNHYKDLGLSTFFGKPGDEPAMAVALALFSVVPRDDQGKGMYTPVGQSGVFKMDSMKGKCEFYKHGKLVSPAIMHFGGGYPEAFHYRRESLKIRIAYRYPFLKPFVSSLVNLFWNPSYIVYVFGYRVIKSLFKGAPFKLSPVMPMFRFE